MTTVQLSCTVVIAVVIAVYSQYKYLDVTCDVIEALGILINELHRGVCGAVQNRWKVKLDIGSK